MRAHNLLSEFFYFEIGVDKYLHDLEKEIEKARFFLMLMNFG